MNSIAITGTGSGFGFALAEVALSRGHHVLSLGRSHHPGTEVALTFDMKGVLVGDEVGLPKVPIVADALILNAFISLDPTPMTLLDSQVLIENIHANVVLNKLLIDNFLRSASLGNIVVDVSSGASVSGYQGWGAYSISKAAIAAMLRTYQVEFPELIFKSVSPGVLATSLNKRLLNAGSDYEWHSKLLDTAREPGVVAKAFLDTIFSLSSNSPSLTRLG